MALNRKGRRVIEKNIKKDINRVVCLQKKLKVIEDPIRRKEIEDQIAKIIDGLDMAELPALDNYITSRKLVD